MSNGLTGAETGLRLGRESHVPAKKIVFLYVEDDEETRYLVSSMLARRFPNITCHCAENGKQGLSLFMEHRPDIVITDLNMPVMDGVTMSEIMKLTIPATIIIAMTAYHNTLMQLKADRAFIDHYILKPIEYRAAFSILEQCILSLQCRSTGQPDDLPL